jgi:hypothetical protein
MTNFQQSGAGPRQQVSSSPVRVRSARSHGRGVAPNEPRLEPLLRSACCDPARDHSCCASIPSKPFQTALDAAGKAQSVACFRFFASFSARETLRYHRGGTFRRMQATTRILSGEWRTEEIASPGGETSNRTFY